MLMFDLLGKNSERVWMPSSRPPSLFVRPGVNRQSATFPSNTVRAPAIADVWRRYRTSKAYCSYSQIGSYNKRLNDSEILVAVGYLSTSILFRNHCFPRRIFKISVKKAIPIRRFKFSRKRALSVFMFETSLVFKMNIEIQI